MHYVRLYWPVAVFVALLMVLLATIVTPAVCPSCLSRPTLVVMSGAVAVGFLAGFPVWRGLMQQYAEDHRVRHGAYDVDGHEEIDNLVAGALGSFDGSPGLETSDGRVIPPLGRAEYLALLTQAAKHATNPKLRAYARDGLARVRRSRLRPV
jgi:hypothetical protein